MPSNEVDASSTEVDASSMLMHPLALNPLALRLMHLLVLRLIHPLALTEARVDALRH